MSVKTEVLTLLESSRDRDLSGQEIAERLGVTRSAVWKAVKSLKEEGYRVDAANNRGYRLADDSDVLSVEGIRLGLKAEYRHREICVCKCVDSTNQEIKRRALDGAEEGLVVIAEEQTAGRGRKGRGFFSPPGTGIYMSVLFCPTAEQSEDVVLVTTAASVAVCRAIREVLQEEAQIKWVNDVYFHGKKICGILTEAVSDIESGRIATVVVGIGINYRFPENGVPQELENIVGAVCDDSHLVPRNTLVAAVLNELYDLYGSLPDKAYMEDYRRWSNVLGREIRFSASAGGEPGDAWEYGTAVDIDEDGGLMVRLQNGEKRVLRTGEITLRIC